MTAEADDLPEPPNPTDKNQNYVGPAANQALFPATSGQPNEALPSPREPASVSVRKIAQKPSERPPIKRGRKP